ncbi:MAG: sulfatase-like hydrolase/transferase [Planctomycetaceae bacterium]
MNLLCSSSLVFCLVLLASPVSVARAASETDRRPNVVVLVADDLGYGETGCQGNSQIPTPHIDSIARRGVRMTSGYVTASFCSASRAGLLTGRYQTRFGYEFNPIGAQNEEPQAGLPVNEQTLADVLHDAGYSTALIGKWHLGGTAKYHPQRRGFDEFFGFLHEGHFYVPPPFNGVTTMLRRRALPDGSTGQWVSPNGREIRSTHMGHDEPDYDADNPLLRSGQPVSEDAYLTTALTREAVSFIDRHADHPFFLYLAYNAVHSPLQATDETLKRFAHLPDIHRRIFAGMLSSLDDSVGEVLGRLAAHQLERRTLIFFISDNGGPTRELTSSNGPLRGEKGSMYEGGLRVPFLVSWPGRIPEQSVYGSPVVSLDIFATAVAAAGVQQQVRGNPDGVNLLPFLDGSDQGRPHDTLYWRCGGRAALRHHQWKIVKPSSRNSSEPWQLFDLDADLSETTDLAESQSGVRDDLVQRWKVLNAEMSDPVWTP